MTDIQRWDFISFDPTLGPHMRKADGGTMAEWVTYADHVAAVAAAEQRVRDELPPNGADALWYLLGQRKGVQAARDAVAAECHHDDPNEWCIFTAAIDALRTEKS